jgi:predicted membrane channel-forming protein YqfA (hemolysin III family)
MAYNNLSTGLSGALTGLVFGVILITMTRTTFILLFIIPGVLFLVGGIIFAIKVPQKENDTLTIDAKIPDKSALTAVIGGEKFAQSTVLEG